MYFLLLLVFDFGVKKWNNHVCNKIFILLKQLPVGENTSYDNYAKMARLRHQIHFTLSTNFSGNISKLHQLKGSTFPLSSLPLSTGENGLYQDNIFYGLKVFKRRLYIY